MRLKARTTEIIFCHSHPGTFLYNTALFLSNFGHSWWSDAIRLVPIGCTAHQVLLSASSPLADGAVGSPLPLKNQEAPPTEDNEEKELKRLRDYVVATTSTHQLHTRVYVPEVYDHHPCSHLGVRA